MREVDLGGDAGRSVAIFHGIEQGGGVLEVGSKMGVIGSAGSGQMAAVRWVVKG